MNKNNNYVKDGITQRITEVAGDNPAEFARRAGISDQSFRMYLKGSMPSAPALLKIANTGGVSADWILTGEVSICDANNASINNIVEIEHIDIVKTFRNKPLAKEINLILIEIEDLGEGHLWEMKGVLGEKLNQLQRIKDHPHDRRKGDRRQSDSDFNSEDRRSGTDRRKSAG